MVFRFVHCTRLVPLSSCTVQYTIAEVCCTVGEVGEASRMYTVNKGFVEWEEILKFRNSGKNLTARPFKSELEHVAVRAL